MFGEGPVQGGPAGSANRGAEAAAGSGDEVFGKHDGGDLA